MSEDKRHLSWEEVYSRADDVYRRMRKDDAGVQVVRVFPIPRGGIMAAMAVSESSVGHVPVVDLCDDYEHADVVIDDIVGSGTTRDRYTGKPFYALVDKPAEGIKSWVVFPWEKDEQAGPEENVRRLIEFIGDDPNREGLLETPERVCRSYLELFAGYKQKPEDVIKTFKDGACDEMVVARNIEFVSFCEHHMLPFGGVAHIAYIPDGKVIGVSKLVRLLEIYARRLQIQERLCQQVTAALDEHLKPLGSACIITAKHLCMSCRGVGKQNSEVVTSSLTGAFRSELSTRQELLELIRGV